MGPPYVVVFGMFRETLRLDQDGFIVTIIEHRVVYSQTGTFVGIVLGNTGLAIATPVLNRPPECHQHGVYEFTTRFVLSWVSVVIIPFLDDPLGLLYPTFPIWLKSFLSNSSMVFQPSSNYGPFLRASSYNNSMICHFAVRCRRHHGGT